MKLRTCGVPGHPPLTPDEQELPQFWDGSEMVDGILPGSRIRLSNVDRVLHKGYPHNRLVLFEHKRDGEVMSGGQLYLHATFREPTLAEVMHVVYTERYQMCPGMEWGLDESMSTAIT